MDILEKQKYHANSAARLLVTRVPTAAPGQTIAQVERKLRAGIRDWESVNYVYVVNGGDKLVGVISIKELLRAGKTDKVSDVMMQPVVYAHPHTSQKRVAFLALKQNIKSVPILDAQGRFLGAVINDSILDVMNREVSGDLFRMAGIRHQPSVRDDVLTLPLLASLRHRLPWLIGGLGGGLIIANVIGAFERVLQANLILTAFIPLIVYIGGAASTQMVAFIIRDLAIHAQLPLRRYVLKHASVVASMALILSVLLGGVVYLFYGNSGMAFVLGVALFFAMLSSIVTGLIIPYLFIKFKQDPANASGPVATILQDLLSVTIYLLIAAALL